MDAIRLFVAILILMGNAYSSDDVIARIELARKLEVPVPKATPYDSDPKAREIYLEEYTKAYRLVVAEVVVGCHMTVNGRYKAAMQDGWNDGRRAAMRRYPEKAAKLGSSLESAVP